MKVSQKPFSKETVLRDLEYSFFELKRNFDLLSKADSSYLKESQLWDHSDPTKLMMLNDAFLNEISRLLHIYLSSFASFIDHTYATMGEIGNPVLEKEYWEQRKKWKTERTAFVKDLHNYSHHRKLPMIWARLGLHMSPDPSYVEKPNDTPQSLPRLHVDGIILKLNKAATKDSLGVQGSLPKSCYEGYKVDGVVRGFPSLQIDKLLDWSGWKADSKKLLKQVVRELEIMPFINEAHRNTVELYNWLNGKIKDW